MKQETTDKDRVQESTRTVEARGEKPRTLRVKTGVKAGGFIVSE